MEIILNEIKVKDLVADYIDNDEGGVKGYHGKLDIRPKYQREFIYKDEQRNAVIDTVSKGYPLNVMYWAQKDDNQYEVIDGQQRTISICQFVNSDYSVNDKYFHNLTEDEKNQILNYKIMIYICKGTESEKLEWFKTINIAGVELTNQELRNAVYSGKWVTEAKKYFSKHGCPAYSIASDYLAGSYIRQDYLETAIKWISNNNIEDYMAKHQHDNNANELWLYFQSVINWVKVTFPKYRKEMKGIQWGEIYTEYKDHALDSDSLEKQITELMMDEDVKNKKGIYLYVLTGKEKYLNIRAFSPNQRREAYERQKGICTICKKHFQFNEMEADHITPWHLGGKTEANNCQMICKEDNRRKSGI
ncbi:HNH endonuclease [Macrococcoides caseolyticum]|uniref:GmrSD restriction endonuclease domain-containing protein n=1 Tax=Macrococcoides caseolyticum TaxID=69966 RepID=UPI000C323020|nr:DUF262 domain-containing protein [Macrococcus caseolyticus]PKE18531.1 HNH endonuclease [Macrococcus caseolyticus]